MARLRRTAFLVATCLLLPVVLSSCLPIALPRSGTVTVADQYGQPAEGVLVQATPQVEYAVFGSMGYGSPLPFMTRHSAGAPQQLRTNAAGMATSHNRMADSIDWHIISDGSFMIVDQSRLYGSLVDSPLSCYGSGHPLDLSLLAWRLPPGETNPCLLPWRVTTELLPPPAWTPIWITPGTGIDRPEAVLAEPDIVVRWATVEAGLAVHLRCLAGGMLEDSTPSIGVAPDHGYASDVLVIIGSGYCPRPKHLIWQRSGQTPRYASIALSYGKGDTVATPKLRWDLIFNRDGGRCIVTPTKNYDAPDEPSSKAAAAVAGSTAWQMMIKDRSPNRTDHAPNWDLGNRIAGMMHEPPATGDLLVLPLGDQP